MHNFFIKLKLIISIFLLSGCSTCLFPDFHVETTQFQDNKIIITFSSCPNFISIKKSLIICQDGYYLEGILTAENNRIIFTPHTKDIENHNYSITITTEAEDTKGISLIENYHYNFSTKKNTTDFDILNFNYTQTEIKFIFSNPLNEKSFYDNFSIKPETSYILRQDDIANQIIVTFIKPLSSNIRYFITLKPEVSDIYNNTLKHKFEDNFILNPENNPTDYDIFYTDQKNSLAKIDINNLNDHLPSQTPLIFKFTDEINLDTVNSAISFTPKINFRLEKDFYTKDSFKIYFTEPNSYNSSYELTVKDSITDIYSNSIPERRIKLLFNCPSDIKPEFKKMLFCSKDSITIIDHTLNPQNLILNTQHYPTVSGIPSDSLTCYFLFSSSPDSSGINLFSAMDNINFSATNSCLSITPEKMTTLKIQDFLSDSKFSEITDILSTDIRQIQLSNLTPSLIQVDCKVQNSSNQGLIKIAINQNLTDTLKNKLSDPINLIINKK